MNEEPTGSNQPPEDPAAAMVRDILVGLFLLAMAGMLIYQGIVALATGHADLNHWPMTDGIDRIVSGPSRHLVLDGVSARLGGLSLLSLAGTILSIIAGLPSFAVRMPGWATRHWGGLLLISFILVLCAFFTNHL